MGVPFPHVSTASNSPPVSPYAHSDLLDFMTRLNAGHPETIQIVADAIRSDKVHELPNGGHATSMEVIRNAEGTMHTMSTLEQSTYAHMAAYAYAHDPSLPWRPGCSRLLHEWDVETVGNCALLSLRGRSASTRRMHRIHVTMWQRLMSRLRVGEGVWG